jgi:L-2-hydroxyglutarate oxidase LhgO
VSAYSGIRAKLTPSGNDGKKRAADFIIQPDPQIPCVVQLVGIESPGLTSAPSIAEQVRDLDVEILGGTIAERFEYPGILWFDPAGQIPRLN